MIKCVMLNAHCTLIAEIVEIDAQLGDPNCKLIKPYVYNGIDVILSPWIILTSDKSIVLPTDWVVTIVEPLPSVKQMYLDKNETFKIREETNE